MRTLWKIDEDFGRGFGVEALFTALAKDVESLIGCEVYFGEISGKHSEITLEIAEDTIQPVEAPPGVLKWLEGNMGTHIQKSRLDWDSYSITGHNPFEYIDWQEVCLPTEEDDG